MCRESSGGGPDPAPTARLLYAVVMNRPAAFRVGPFSVISCLVQSPYCVVVQKTEYDAGASAFVYTIRSRFAFKSARRTLIVPIYYLIHIVPC